MPNHLGPEPPLRGVGTVQDGLVRGHVADDLGEVARLEEVEGSVVHGGVELRGADAQGPDFGDAADLVIESPPPLRCELL